jgi:hypothetical protein
MATIGNLQQKDDHVPDSLDGAVVPAYEVFFGRFGTATAQWLERVHGLGCACERMKELAHKEPGSYFVFCSRTRRLLAYIDTTITSRNATRHLA